MMGGGFDFCCVECDGGVLVCCVEFNEFYGGMVWIGEVCGVEDVLELGGCDFVVFFVGVLLDVVGEVDLELVG